MKKYYIFTDGSTLGNNFTNKLKRSGGIGVYFPMDRSYNLSIPIKKEPSNNKAEMMAILLGIRQFNKYLESNDPQNKSKEKNGKKLDLNNVKLVIVTDSRFGIDLITKWMNGWKSKGWRKADGKTPANIELVKALDIELENVEYTVTMKHINSHRVAPRDTESKEYFFWYGNSQADLLATTAAKSI